MYGETRSHARNTAPLSQANLTGASITVLALTLVGYGLVAGLGAPVLANLPRPLVAVIMPETVEPKLPEPPLVREIDEVRLTAPTNPFPFPDFIPVDRPADDRVVAVAEPALLPSPFAGTGSGVTPKPPAAPVPPKLMARETPPYPTTEIRARHEGVSSLSLCVDARGRVTSAQLAASSGYSRLDDAALKWIRSARFKPATQDGAPVAACDVAVDYEWRIEDAR
jgi:protein TonB